MRMILNFPSEEKTKVGPQKTESFPMNRMSKGKKIEDNL